MTILKGTKTFFNLSSQKVKYQDPESCEPPKCDRSRKRFRDCRPSELDADQELGWDDGHEDPRLPAESVAFRIVEKLKRFPEADGSPQQDEGQPDPVEPVFWKKEKIKKSGKMWRLKIVCVCQS